MKIILGASLMLNVILILGYRAVVDNCKKQIEIAKEQMKRMS